ncbi:MAG TPA: hypothetical protein VGQ53_03815 [Chitinophagaceae bacterium]|jgi:hypothetical protein|nr:hypothetical protein [Chitinophagaceae bacterium]
MKSSYAHRSPQELLLPGIYDLRTFLKFDVRTASNPGSLQKDIPKKMI